MLAQAHLALGLTGEMDPVFGCIVFVLVVITMVITIVNGVRRCMNPRTRTQTQTDLEMGAKQGQGQEQETALSVSDSHLHSHLSSGGMRIGVNMGMT